MAFKPQAEFATGVMDRFMISTKQLTYALAVEKMLHFKKAAQMCNISQSALSTALTELERQLGLQIFERDNKKVLVTPIGKEVLEKAQKIILQIRDLEQLGRAQDGPFSYPITVGAIPTIAPYLLPKMFPPLYKKFPDARITVVEDQSHALVDLLRQGELDAAILALPYPCDGLLTLEFWQEDFYWITLQGKARAKQKEITSSEIDQHDLMLLKEGHCLKDHIVEVCQFSNQGESETFGAASLNTLIQMVLGNLGSTLIPAMALDQLTSNNKKLSAVHLIGGSPHRRIAFVMRPNSPRMNAIKTLMDICTKALSS